MKKAIGAILLAAALALPALGSHAPSEVEAALDDGGLRHSESFRTNLFVYKSIGGETSVKSKEKKRRWWCLFLCKTRSDKIAESITVQNIYFSEVQPGVFARLERPAKECQFASSCSQKEWSVGFGVKLPFPGEGGTPGATPVDLPVDGVITRHGVFVDGEVIVLETSLGKHPAPTIF